MVKRTAVVAALATTLLLAGVAAGDPGSEKARIDAQTDNARAQAQQAAGTEGVLTTELSAITSRVRAAASDVETEQAKLDALEVSLATERVRLASLGQRIVDETARLEVLEAEYTKAVTVLERRVREIYESDSPDLIGFALGTTSFADLLDNLELLDRIGQQDEQIAASLDSTQRELQQTRAATERARRASVRSEALIAARARAQRATRDGIVAQRDALAAAENEKASALATVREDRASFLAEAGALAAQSAALAQRIEAAQNAAATSSSSVAQASGGGGGQLGWPVVGPVTSGFGSRWGRMHEGIDIAVGSGTPVHAAADGTVVYAGWISGYGNIVVIDHGNGISTAYAHNSSLLVGQGATVAGGTVVSLSGSTGHSTGPHVHFEVRLNGSPVDPLSYL